LSVSALLLAANGLTVSEHWFDVVRLVHGLIKVRLAGFVVVVLENTNKATALGTPYYQNLTTMGMLLNGYQGITATFEPHDSAPD